MSKNDPYGVPNDPYGAPPVQAETPAKLGKAEENAFFYMAAAVAYYAKDGKLYDRHVNVLIQIDIPHITREALNHIQRNVIARITAENGVAAEAIKDTVILNISPLGQMTESQFNA